MRLLVILVILSTMLLVAVTLHGVPTATCIDDICVVKGAGQ